MIRKELDLSTTSSFFWIDSTAMLCSIKNTTKRFTVFVANCLASIERNSNVIQWRHVPSKLNPADSVSSGLKTCSWDTVKWLKGSEFLLRSQSEWLELNTSPELPPEFLENKGQVKVFNICGPSVCVFEHLISRCFNIYELKCVMAWILRYVSVIRSHLEGKPVSFDDHNIEPLTPNHIPLFQGNPNLPPGLFQESDSYAC